MAPTRDDSRMSGSPYFFELASQAFEATWLFPPVTVLMLAGDVGAVVLMPTLSRHQFARALGVTLLPLAFPIAILLCGTLLGHKGGYDVPAPAWPNNLGLGLVWSHMIVAITL